MSMLHCFHRAKGDDLTISTQSGMMWEWDAKLFIQKNKEKETTLMGVELLLLYWMAWRGTKQTFMVPKGRLNWFLLLLTEASWRNHIWSALWSAKIKNFHHERTKVLDATGPQRGPRTPRHSDGDDSTKSHCCQNEVALREGASFTCSAFIAFLQQADRYTPNAAIPPRAVKGQCCTAQTTVQSKPATHSEKDK